MSAGVVWRSVAQQSGWIAAVHESNERKKHAVADKGLDSGAALPGALSRNGQTVIFLLASPGLAILCRCGEPCLVTVIRACTMPDGSQKENRGPCGHDRRYHLAHVDVCRGNVPPEVAFGVDQSRASVFTKIIQRQDQGRTARLPWMSRRVLRRIHAMPLGLPLCLPGGR